MSVYERTTKIAGAVKVAANAAGLKPSYVHKVFIPPYWTDRMMASPAGKVQVLNTLSSALHINPQSWLTENPQLGSLGSLNCYTRAGVAHGEVRAPHRVLVRAA